MRERMETYIGTKIVDALPMTRGEYNRFKGWVIPKNENPDDEGFIVQYSDDYISWSPKETFEQSYRKSGEFDFGHAVLLLKLGYKVARKGWNGKNMFVVYQKGYPDGIACNKQTAEAWGMNEGDLFKVRPYLQLRTAQGDHAMWTPSTSDALADDWEVIA